MNESGSAYESGTMHRKDGKPKRNGPVPKHKSRPGRLPTAIFGEPPASPRQVRERLAWIADAVLRDEVSVHVAYTASHLLRGALAAYHDEYKFSHFFSDAFPNDPPTDDLDEDQERYFRELKASGQTFGAGWRELNERFVEDRLAHQRRTEVDPCR